METRTGPPRVTGTTPEMLDIREWPVASGRSFTQQDVDGATKVCLLGMTVVENLFGGIDPVGQIVRIKNVPFTVVGVLSSKGQSTWGQDQDDTVIVPLTTAQKRLFGMQFPGMVRVIAVQAKGPEMMKEAEDQINDLLRQRHRIQPNQDNDFTVRNLTEIMATAEQSANVMSLLLGAIASISLIVGGIGIMNIMLVSVTERTREIGIRIAVGAKSKDILLQFLIESLVLSLIGGILGIAIGIAGTYILSSFTQWPTLLSIQAIFLAFFFCWLRRGLFWILSCEKSLLARSHRSPPLRIEKSASVPVFTSQLQETDMGKPLFKASEGD